MEIRTVDIDYRVPYGVISNRHSKGALPDEYPINTMQISIPKLFPSDMDKDIGTFRPENGRPDLRFAPQAVYGHHGL